MNHQPEKKRIKKSIVDSSLIMRECCMHWFVLVLGFLYA